VISNRLRNMQPSARRTSRAPAYSYQASERAGQRAQGPAFPKTVLDERTVTTTRLQPCCKWGRNWGRRTRSLANYL